MYAILIIYGENYVEGQFQGDPQTNAQLDVSFEGDPQIIFACWRRFWEILKLFRI